MVASRYNEKMTPRPDQPPQDNAHVKPGCELFDHARADDNGMAQPRGAVGATGALPGWSGPLPDGPQPGLKQSLLDGMTSAQRKEYPITTGCLRLFP